MRFSFIFHFFLGRLPFFSHFFGGRLPVFCWGRLSCCVKIRLHTKNQLPKLSGGALQVSLGGVVVVVVLLITFSLPTWIEVELGCDNRFLYFLALTYSCYIAQLCPSLGYVSGLVHGHASHMLCMHSEISFNPHNLLRLSFIQQLLYSNEEEK